MYNFFFLVVIIFTFIKAIEYADPKIFYPITLLSLILTIYTWLLFKICTKNTFNRYEITVESEGSEIMPKQVRRNGTITWTERRLRRHSF